MFDITKCKGIFAKILPMSFRAFIILILLGTISCQPGPPDASEELDKLAKAYELQPSNERANAYLNKASEYISANKDDFDLIRPMLSKAADIAFLSKMYSKTAGFLMPILREEGSTVENRSTSIRLGQVLRRMRKNHAATIIGQGLKEQFPQDPEVDKLQALMDTTVTSSEAYLKHLFDLVLKDPDEFGINRQNALRFVDAAEAFALMKPTSKNTPKYLYQAAEIARSLRTMPKAMSLYDWLLEEYPDHEKSPTVLFIKGFLLEQEFQDDEEARNIYEQFLEKYPDHEMASSAKFLLENMGKSDEEILRTIEEKRRAQEQ